ncbi:lipopolysaccharide biosynthesis protein [Arthrobacter sp. CP30]
MSSGSAAPQPEQTRPTVSGTWYLVGSLLQGLGLLLIQPFAIRILDDRQWGIVSTSVVTIQVLVVLISAGLPLAITNIWFARERGQDRSRAMYGFMVLASAALAVVVVLCLLLLGAFGSGGPAPSTVLAVISVGVLGSVLGAQAVLRAQNRPGHFVLLSIGSSVLANLLGLVGLILVAPTAEVYLGAYTLAVVLTGAAALVLARPRLPWRVAGSSRESIRIAGPLLPHTGALMLLTQGSVLILAYAATVEDAGRFGAVLIFALGPITILNALNNAWSTRMMSAARGELVAVTRRVSVEAIAWSTGVGLLASSGAVVGSTILSTEPEIVRPIAAALPLVSIGYALFLVTSNLLYIDDRTRRLALVTPGVLVAIALLALWPASRSEVVVVAIVQVLGFVALGLLTYALVRRSDAGRSLPLPSFGGAFGVHVVVVLLLGLVPFGVVAGMVQAAVVAALLAGALFLARSRRTADRATSSS